MCKLAGVGVNERLGVNKQICHPVTGEGTIMQSAEDVLLEKGIHQGQDSNCVRGSLEQSSKISLYLNRKEKHGLNAENHLEMKRKINRNQSKPIYCLLDELPHEGLLRHFGLDYCIIAKCKTCLINEKGGGKRQDQNNKIID